MHITAILSEDRTAAQVDASSKKKATELVAKIFADSIPSIDGDELFKCLVARERLGTTGIGEGIAIPHCRFNTGGSTFAACITLAKPIDYDSFDNKPVDIIFAMLVPENAEASHLDTLANLAEKFQTSDFAQNLRNAETPEVLFREAIE